MSDVKNQPAPQETRGKAFGRTYWLLNGIEMFERLAYFGIRAVVPLYIMQAAEPGGLHLTAFHKGTIYAWWAVFQSFLPIVTGGIADRYGYKRVLFFAISMNVLGYVLMANLHNYVGFFFGVLVLATGTAFFKPSLQGSLAQNLTKANSSLGWGVFYWVVNVGAFAAPFLSTIILGKPHSLAGWQKLFYTCAGFTACNILILFTFKDVPSGADKTESPLQVLKRTFVNIFEARLIIWLLIMSCFWLMMYQLWDLHPNFITDWVDSSMLAVSAPDVWREYGDRGLLQIPQQILLNLNAGLIILLMVPLSWVARKMRTLSAMLVGMSVATIGVLVAGLTANAWFLLLGIVFFSLGEMWTGPKKNEYLGLIAPPGKKGLYLGYVNIPVGIGLFVGSYLAGFVYDNFGEKASLALKELGARPELVGRAAQASDWSGSLEKIPQLIAIERQDAFGFVQEEMGFDEAGTAEALCEAFRYDRGQITNLAFIYLAQHDPYAEKVEAELGVDPRSVSSVSRLADSIHEVPGWTDVKRGAVFELLYPLVAEQSAGGGEVSDSEVTDLLWDRYGADPAVLNNLALEYLAQATSRVRDAVEQIEIDDPVEEIPSRIGIDRTESFMALSAARGASPEEVRRGLAGIEADGDGPHARLFVYLADRPHVRFPAVARHDWVNDKGLLRSMIESDAAAKATVEAEVWELGLWERILSTFGRDIDRNDMYARLSEKPELIQKALAEKDWARTPDQAARVFGMNPFEARALAAAEMNNAPLETTQYLWKEYDPQFKVWIPFAIIGVIATIALGIFGQMAKRWKDMNA